MEDDQAICRVCRGESSLSHPLFHPCKCSGSIRFVHQECLLQWLSHSKKKYCELCEYPFVFTPIYRQDMPDRLPSRVLLNQITRRIASTLLTLVRSILVIIVWIILLPTLTLWTWRFYFWSGENIGFASIDARNNSLQESTTTEEEPSYFLIRYHWREFLSDCFQGQIITAVVVIVFVAAYLFREWVIQNTAPNPENQPEINVQPNNHNNQQLAQQQATVDDILQAVRSVNTTDQTVLNEREQTSARLEELRRELLRRRRLIETNNHEHNRNREEEDEFDNPYANNSMSPGATSYFHLNNNTRLRANLNLDSDEENDTIFTNPPSGTQSPFASWRDYQQDNSSSSLNHNNMDDQRIASNSTGAWRAREFSSSTGYFTEQLLDETLLEEEDDNEEINNMPVHPPPPPPPPPEPIIPPNDGNNNNEMPFDFVEDIDGILEAIGMRRNALMMVQNSILMSLMINLCLCVAVWIPYVIGRSVILIHPLNLVGSPIYLLRLLTAPMIDFGIDKVIWPAYTNFTTLSKYILPDSILIAIKTINDDAICWLYFIFKSIHITLLDPSGGSLGALLTETTNSIINSSKINNWELIRDNIYSISAVIFKRWRQCATGQGNLDRTVCTCVGYVILISIGSFYLSRNKSTRAGSTNEILRQQAVFLKVLFFIFLELVIFPTVCGVLLDISTLPLFTGWSIKSRFHFVLLNPYSGVFLHWFVGTGFIFQFSVFITLVREVVRPGVLYFMPDPNDPQFHPVQDMVDQPLLTLLRKLIRTAAIYFMLILVGMGVVTLLVSKYGGIYPIIWKFDIPISSLSIDLLAVQFLMPPIMSYIVPREFSKKTVITWWHIVSRTLRLSSFMFGGRYPDEEGVYAWKTWVHCLIRRNVGVDAEERKDGGLVRVPTHDNVPVVVPRRRMIVPVHPITLQPLDETERRLGHPAVRQSGDEERDTTIVYIPPFFKIRITIFLLFIWTTGSILFCSISVVPLKLGRNLFAKLQLGPDKPIHDLYSFAVGAYVMILLSSMLNAIVQKYHIVRNDQGRVNWSLVQSYLFGKIRKAAKFAYMFLTFGLVIPFLIGIAMDLYILMPLRLSDVHEETLDLYLTIDWTLGVAALSIFYGIVCIFPNSALREQVVQFRWENIENLDYWHISRRVTLPFIAYLCAVLIVPSVLYVATTYLLAIDDSSIMIFIFRCIYPILFCLACCVLLLALLARLINIWLRSIRDDTYLVGKQLHNLEEA